MAVSMTMPTPLERFQSLQRELFQFDCQDLDFGIYRVLNFKRREIEEFITTRLPQRVDAAFARYAEADQAAAARELDQKRQQILATLGPDAFDATGQLTMAFRETPLGRQFAELQQQTRASRVADELKESVFNDLYAFFSRYYDEGDIFSKPRRGKVEIPFTGHEDVVLHWANKDQYYIKTGEQFKSYRFKLPDENAAVVFALRNVSTEPNGNRAEKRYFVLAAQNPVEWTEDGRQLTVYFEYRPLTAAEKETYGKTENQKPQDKLNAEAEPAILRRVKDPAVKARLAQPTGEDKPSLLLQHLTRFTRKNTADFFIHKDLRGFLTRELDDFLKTEVLKTNELLAGDPEVPRRALLRARVVREIGLDLIDWLAQIEDFQKKLFEKRKFVVRTEYCVTLDRLPESLWDEVLANKAQIAEWRQLYALDDLLKADKKKKPDRDFLKAHDKLVVDTRHFPEAFKWRLLEAFDDLDAALDGLCIKSENFQALALLLAKYRERVKCIYIDPPFNTGEDFFFRDQYQDSSWLALMENRIGAAKPFLTGDGTFFLHLDWNANFYGRLLLNSAFGKNALVNEIVWRIGWVSGFKTQAEGFVRNHDTIFLYANDSGGYFFDKDAATIAYRSFSTDSIEAELASILKKWQLQDVDIKSKKLVMRDSDDRVYKIGLEAGDGRYWMEDTWNCSEYEELHSNKIKRNAKEYTPNGSVITQKPEQLLRRILEVASRQGDIILDFFAGSATSLAVAQKLRRKWIGVEVESYFESDALYRMKHVLAGRTSREPVGISKAVGWLGGGFFKYQVLEQYEDALNNLELPRAHEGELALKTFGDEYLLKYMLEFETAGSPSLLNIERLTHPFAYRLKVQEGDEIVERTVDLVETFNYLLGLHVKKLREFQSSADCQSAVSRTASPRKRRLPMGAANPPAATRLYRAVLGEDRRGKSVVVVWRDTAGLEANPAALQADRLFIEEKILPALLGKEARPDRLLVNQPCTAVEAEAIEPEFKRLMFAPLG